MSPRNMNVWNLRAKRIDAEIVTPDFAMVGFFQDLGLESGFAIDTYYYNKKS